MKDRLSKGACGASCEPKRKGPETGELEVREIRVCNFALARGPDVKIGRWSSHVLTAKVKGRIRTERGWGTYQAESHEDRSIEKKDREGRA